MFALTADHLAVRDMAKSFADERIAPYALKWDETEHFPVDVLRDAAALGMAAIYVSEQHGGSGMTRLDAALIFEALSTGCPSIASFLSIHNMVAWVVDRFGSPDLKARYLKRLAGMELIASYCLTEPGAGSDAAALMTRARRDGAEYVLDGVKQFISGAGASDVYLVMARTGEGGAGGVSAFLVEKDAPGFSFGAKEKKMGWRAQPTRQVIMEGVRAPAANLVGAEGDGFKIAMAGLDGGRLNIGACSIGGGQAALDKALRLYARAQGVRPPHRRLPGAAVPRRRHRDLAGDRALDAVARGKRARRALARGDAPVRDGQAGRHRRRLQRRQRRAATVRRLWLPRRLRRRETRARPPRASDPRRARTRSCGSSWRAG